MPPQKSRFWGAIPKKFLGFWGFPLKKSPQKAQNWGDFGVFPTKTGGCSPACAGFPLWLALLWLGFALTLAHGLRWLVVLPRWQQALIGGLGGASSYLAGAAMGAVHLPWGLWISGGVLAVIWVVWLPVLQWTMGKLNACIPAPTGVSTGERQP